MILRKTKLSLVHLTMLGCKSPSSADAQAVEHTIHVKNSRQLTAEAILTIPQQTISTH